MAGLENYSDVFVSIAILLVFIVLSKVVYFFLKKVVSSWTEKTKTTLDDEILKAVEKPIYVGVIFLGVYFALMHLSGLVNYFPEIHKLFGVLYILLGTFFVVGLVNAVFKWYGKEVALKTETKLDDQFLPIARKIVDGFIYAIAFILILREAFNIEITPLVASLGIAGLAVALALQDTLSNFFAGAYLIADRPIQAGDFIELEDGKQGFVEDIGWRSTRIKTVRNNMIVIPNSKLSQSIITNFYSPEKEMSVFFSCGVSYDSDLSMVERVTLEAAKEIQNTIPGAVKSFEPFMRFNEFGDSNIKFSIVLRIDSFLDRNLVIHEFMKLLTDRYRSEKIEISYPWTNVYLKESLNEEDDKKTEDKKREIKKREIKKKEN